MCSVVPALGGRNTVHWYGCRWALCTRMVIFHESGSSISYHQWITYRGITSCTSLRSDQIKSCQNYTLVVVKVGCLVNLEALLVFFLVGSVPKVGLARELNKKRATSGFGFQAMLGGSICVSGPCTLHIYCETRYKIAYYQYAYLVTITTLWWASLDVLYIWKKFLYVDWEVQFWRLISLG